MDLDLVKKVELVLEKKGFSTKIEAKVCLCLDESGSMTDMFRNGTVSRTIDRALAIGYKFDDDGEIDVWSFSGSRRFCRREPATQDQYGSYLKHSMMGGSTVYHQVLEAIAEDYFKPKIDVKTEKTSFLSKMFGKKDTVETTEIPPTDLPAFVCFITDGVPDSDYEALREVGRILKMYPKLFVQFIGIGHGRFATLETLAKENANAAFATINANDSDDTVLDKFLNEKARKVLEA